jgi:hypothetical protein
LEPSRPALAQYSNYFAVGQNAFEFLIDFGQFSAESAAVHFHTRVATAPAFAKLLLETLESAIRAHEAEYGDIGSAFDQLELPSLLLQTLPDLREQLKTARGSQEQFSDRKPVAPPPQNPAAPRHNVKPRR